ncbi:MAG: glutamine amidotransferase [Pseudomonadota bacterium]
MTKRVAAIRHVHFEDLGLLEPLLRNRGFDLTYHNAWDADLRGVVDADLLVILGGPISANETDEYPFLKDEIAVAAHRLARRQATLGLCLGAQIITRAIGGTVKPGPEKEIGWAPLEITSQGEATPLIHLANTPVLHWHGEICMLPDGIVSLARTLACDVQAFAVGDTGLGLQFHAEAGTSGIEPWLIGHTLEIAQAAGKSVVQLREDTQRFGSELEKAGALFFNAWLDQAGL